MKKSFTDIKKKPIYSHQYVGVFSTCEIKDSENKGNIIERIILLEHDGLCFDNDDIIKEDITSEYNVINKGYETEYSFTTKSGKIKGSKFRNRFNIPNLIINRGLYKLCNNNSSAKKEIINWENASKFTYDTFSFFINIKGVDIELETSKDNVVTNEGFIITVRNEETEKVVACYYVLDNKFINIDFDGETTIMVHEIVDGEIKLINYENCISAGSYTYNTPNLHNLPSKLKIDEYYIDFEYDEFGIVISGIDSNKKDLVRYESKYDKIGESIFLSYVVSLHPLYLDLFNPSLTYGHKLWCYETIEFDIEESLCYYSRTVFEVENEEEMIEFINIENTPVLVDAVDVSNVIDEIDLIIREEICKDMGLHGLREPKKILEIAGINFKVYCSLSDHNEKFFTDDVIKNGTKALSMYAAEVVQDKLHYDRNTDFIDKEIPLMNFLEHIHIYDSYIDYDNDENPYDGHYYIYFNMDKFTDEIYQDRKKRVNCRFKIQPGSGIIVFDEAKVETILNE